MDIIHGMNKVPSMILGTSEALLVLMSAVGWAQEEPAMVEGILGYGEKTIEVETAQDLVDAVDEKNNITVLLKRDITVTDQVPVHTGLINNSPCWGQSHLFNLSNYVFRSKLEQVILHLSFAPTEGATVGKVVRNGKAEFCHLGNLSFSGIRPSSVPPSTPQTLAAPALVQLWESHPHRLHVGVPILPEL